MLVLFCGKATTGSWSPVALCTNTDQMSKKQISLLQVFLVNLNKTHQVDVNGKQVHESILLQHKDIFTIIDRSFRLELPFPPKKKMTPSKAASDKDQVAPKVGILEDKSWILL